MDRKYHSNKVTNKQPFNYGSFNGKNLVPKESMPQLQALARDRIKYLEAILNDCNVHMKKMPAGTLGSTKHGSKYQYYWNQPESADECSPVIRKYIKESEIDIAKSLAQKSYLKKLSATIKRELKLLYPLIKLDQTPLESIYDELPSFRKILVNPYAIPDSDYFKMWNEIPYEKNNIIEETVFLTNKNERVRSKSEVNIANMLDKYDIPYKYEVPMQLIRNETIYPDFLCLNKRTREQFIWEHFGMMDDIGYLRKNYAKLQDYELKGYMPGKKLIVTFETAKQPLDSRIIQATIKNYLL